MTPQEDWRDALRVPRETVEEMARNAAQRARFELRCDWCRGLVDTSPGQGSLIPTSEHASNPGAYYVFCSQRCRTMWEAEGPGSAPAGLDSTHD
jgi:hypothetical protein